MGKLSASKIDNGAINVNNNNSDVMTKLQEMEKLLVASVNGNRQNEIVNQLTKLNGLQLDVALANIARQLKCLQDGINDLAIKFDKDCLRRDKQSPVENSNRSGNGNNPSDKQSDKPIDANMGMGPRTMEAAIDLTCSTVKTGNGKMVLETICKDKNNLKDKETFSRSLKNFWKNQPNYTSLISLKNINKFVDAAWENLSSINTAKTPEVTKENPASKVTKLDPVDYFAKVFDVDRNIIVGLINNIQVNYNKGDLDNGKFDEADTNYLLTKALGKDISKHSKAGGFIGTLLSYVK